MDGLEPRALLTAFTMMSPAGLAPLLAEIPPAGGIVLDLIGVNGGRVEAQLAPDALFRGTSQSGTPASGRGNPVTLGIQAGLTPDPVRSLGGGLSAVAVRLTTSVGGTGPGEPFRSSDVLLVNGIPLGYFGDVVTEETTPDGLVSLSLNPAGGFRSGSLDTGFFHSADPTVAAQLWDSILQTGKVVYQVQQGQVPGPVWDFTSGLTPELAHPRQTPVFAINPPRITEIVAPGPLDEGTTATITVKARVGRQNPNNPPPLDYQFDVQGDGSYALRSSTGIATLLLERPGSLVIPVRVVTLQGTFALGQATVVVRNLPPLVEAPADQTAFEGSAAAIDLGRFSDPGPDSPWTVQVDWGDGSPEGSAVLAARGGLGQEEHVYLQDGAYEVTVTVTDSLGASSQNRFRVRVENLPPAIGALAAISPVRLGEDSALSFRASDPGPLDTLTIQVDWGDGTATVDSAAAGPQDFRTSHRYAAAGTYTVAVTVRDDGGGMAEAVTTLVVQAPFVPIGATPPGSDAPITTLAFLQSANARVPASSSPYQARFGPGVPRKPAAQSLPPKPGGPGSSGEAPPPGGRSLEQILAILLERKPAVGTIGRRIGLLASGGQAGAGGLGPAAPASGTAPATDAGPAGLAAGIRPGPPGPAEPAATSSGRATRIMMLVVWTLSLRHQRWRRRSRTRLSPPAPPGSPGSRV